MNLVNKKIGSFLSRVDYIFFGLSLFTLTLSIKLSSKFLLSAIILGLFKALKRNNFKWFFKHNPITYIYSIFVLYLLIQGVFIEGSIFFSQAFERYYAPYFTLVLIPIFFQHPEQVRYIPAIIALGLFSTFLLIICFSIIEFQVFNREQVLEVFDIHHLYISLNILFTINHLLFAKNQLQLLSRKPAKFFILSALYLALVFFKSKAAIAVGALLLLFYFIKSLKSNRFSIIILLAIALLVIFNTFFVELYKDALDFRSRIWVTSMDLIFQNSLFGFGNSQEIQVLNQQHFFNGDYYLLDSNLNAHNQIITFTLKFGLIGCILMLYPFAYLFVSIKQKINFELLGFLFLLFSMMLIESMYNRHHGITFVTTALYYYFNLNYYPKTNSQ